MIHTILIANENSKMKDDEESRTRLSLCIKELCILNLFHLSMIGFSIQAVGAFFWTFKDLLKTHFLLFIPLINDIVDLLLFYRIEDLINLCITVYVTFFS